MMGESLTDEFTSVGDFQIDKENDEILYVKATYKDKAPIYSDLVHYNIKEKKTTQINYRLRWKKIWHKSRCRYLCNRKK